MGKYELPLEVGGTEHGDRYFDLILEFNKIFHSFQTYGTQKDLVEITWRLYDVALKALHKAEDEFRFDRSIPPHSLKGSAKRETSDETA